jgi:aryl-alcohol dehydrogenase-like predicted oxidoreductase
VYQPEKALLALQTDGIGFVQVPSNVLDRRFEDCGVFQMAAEKQKCIYVRSVFLQGLLLMSEQDLPGEMGWAREHLRKLDALARKTGTRKRDLAMGYVKQAYPEAKIVVGVETVAQLEENLASWSSRVPGTLVGQVQTMFRGISECFLNPGLWMQNRASTVT